MDADNRGTAPEQIVLKATCPAGKGIIAGITGLLAEHGCYISELAQFDDHDRGQFFMRARFHSDKPTLDLDALHQALQPVADGFQMTFSLHTADVPTKTLIMVSKVDHCLDDLLYRHHKGELNMEIAAVISNHLSLRPMVERTGIRFIHLPVTPENQPEQEQRLMEVIEETGVELVILARYMRILSDRLCDALKGRIINIHHSFLPGFKGARPYYQAYERGVKLIGATAHYVTADLDEGPIIEQAVQSVDHTYSPEMLTAVGRDTETMALAKAVKLHTEHRVFLDGNKTVIFR